MCSSTGREKVRTLAATQPQIACCDIGQIEVSSVFHRKFREGAVDAAQHLALSLQLEQDVRGGVWSWLPINALLLDSVRLAFRTLPSTVFLRANDALHLVSAREKGFKEIHSNDRHLLAAAPHFGLRGVNV